MNGKTEVKSTTEEKRKKGVLSESGAGPLTNPTSPRIQTGTLADLTTGMQAAEVHSLVPWWVYGKN